MITLVFPRVFEYCAKFSAFESSLSRKNDILFARQRRSLSVSIIEILDRRSLNGRYTDCTTAGRLAFPPCLYVFTPRCLHLDTRISSVVSRSPWHTEQLLARGTKTVRLRSEGRQAFHWQVAGVQGKKRLSYINSLTDREGTNVAECRGSAKTKRIDHRRPD